MSANTKFPCDGNGSISLSRNVSLTISRPSKIFAREKPMNSSSLILASAAASVLAPLQDLSSDDARSHPASNL